MNVKKFFAALMAGTACVLALIAVILLAFVPFATEVEDALGPLAGAVVFCASATAVLINAREFVRFRALPRASIPLFHAVNIVALVLVGILGIPAMLYDVIYTLETKALMLVGMVLIAAYAVAAKNRHS